VAAGLRLLFKAARQPFKDHRVRGQSGLSEVIIQEDENFERALKRFKKKVEKAGILADLRKHRHYEKPSEKRKRKMNAATRKNRRHRAM
jgi:small subunit ribosomal protein S21